MRYHTVEEGHFGEYTFVMGPVVSGRTAKPGAKLLGDYLKELRSRRKESLRSVAAATGISNAYFSQLENNKRGKVPSVKVLSALAQHFDVQLDTLLFVSGLRRSPQREPQGELTDRQQLELLLRHPAFALVVVGSGDLRWMSDEVVRGWMDFARTLESNLRQTGEGLEALQKASLSMVVQGEDTGGKRLKEGEDEDQE